MLKQYIKLKKINLQNFLSIERSRIYKFSRFTFYIKKFFEILYLINLHKFIFSSYRFLIWLNKKNIHLYYDYAYFLIKNKRYLEIISMYKEALNHVEKEFLPKLNFKIGLVYFNFIKKNSNDNNYLSQFYLLNNFDKSINQIIYPPKLLLSKIEYNQELIDKMYAFEKTNLVSTHYRTNFEHFSQLNKITGSFQSHHKIHQDKEFYEFYIHLEKILNKTINKHFVGQKHYLKIKKMWFLITRKGAKVEKHNHSADLSGVVYIKIPKKDDEANIHFENPQQNLQLINFKDNPNLPTISLIDNSLFKFKPEDHDLIIFNSYLSHAVFSGHSNNEHRISLAWDANFV